MKHKPFIISHYSTNVMPTRNTVLPGNTFEAYIEQAELCCEQARVAARTRRFKTACNLYMTAATLYRRALALDSTPYPAVENRLRDIKMEISLYDDSAKPTKGAAWHK